MNAGANPTQNNPDSHNTHLKRPQYDNIDRSTTYQSYKCHHGIQGSILVLAAAANHHSPQPQVDYSPPNIDIANIFSPFCTLPYEVEQHPLHAFPVVDNKADTLTQSQMLWASNSTDFLASQPKEIKGLVDMEVFDIKPMSAKPASAHLLSSIWSYRRKRSLVGTILKHKARLCINGSQQAYGRDYWEVYAPVVSWPTIHLLLLLATILGLKQCQVDYTQAFLQAPLTDPVYM